MQCNYEQAIIIILIPTRTPNDGIWIFLTVAGSLHSLDTLGLQVDSESKKYTLKTGYLK